MVRTTCAALIGFLGLATQIRAQPNTWLRDTIEKRGWQYLTTIDSVDRYGVRPDVFGDTILFRYYKAPRYEPHVFVSMDGGKSIDHEWVYPVTINYYKPLPFASDPIEIMTAHYAYGDPSDTLKITTDLGRTWQTRRMDTTGMGFPNQTYTRRAWLDPTDDATIYVELGDSSNFDAGIPHSFYIRSKDTGKTWERLALPEPHGGLGTTRGMLMDMRQHGLWYTLVAAKKLQFAQWYRTEDNGVTLECCVDGPELDPEGQLAGLRYSGEICSPWGPDLESYRIRHGYHSRDANGGHDTILDWVDSLLPGRPDTLQASHGTYIGFSGAGLPFFEFQIHPRSPDRLLLPIAEKWSDNEGNSHNRQRWFYSTDAGARWTEVWSDTLNVEMRQDRRTPGVVWLTATDGIWGASKNASYLVFKRDLRSIDAVGEAPKHSVTPAPVLSFREMALHVTGNSTFDELSLVDILGRECLRVLHLNKCLTSQLYTTSFVPSSSQYFGVFRSKDGNVIVVPVQIER